MRETKRCLIVNFVRLKKGNNRSANSIHNLFERFLQTYSLKDHFLDPLKVNSRKAYQNLTEPEKMISMKLKTHHRKVAREIKMLEECNSLGYVDLKVFNSSLSKLQREKMELENHLAMTSHDFRNSSLFLDELLRTALVLTAFGVP